MQAIGTTPIRGIGQTYYRRNRGQRTVQHKPEREAARTRRDGYDFLNGTIKPHYTPTVTRRGYDGEEYELITQENYIFLRDSYLRYAELLGLADAKHNPGDNHSEGIANLYWEMKALLKDKECLNFDYSLGRLYFTIWRTHKWGEFELYWFPVKFLSLLNPKLRRITVTFLHEFMKSNGLYVTTDLPDYEMTTDWLDGSLHEYAEEERRFYQAILKSYESGEAQRTLTRVKTKRYYKNLPLALRRYQPVNDYERTLLELMWEGLQFIGEDKPGIMQFGYDPYSEEEPDWQPMDLERQIRITYDLNDIITESVTDTFNCEQRETYAIVPTTTLELSPDTDTVFAMSDYPERFFRWADKFVNHIE